MVAGGVSAFLDRDGLTVVDIVIEKGARFDLDFEYVDDDGNPINATGWTARSHTRKTLNSDTILLECSTDDGRFVIDNNIISLRLNASLTKQLNWEGKAVFDIELVPPSGEDDVVRLAKGTMKLSGEVTRES